MPGAALEGWRGGPGLLSRAADQDSRRGRDSMASVPTTRAASGRLPMVTDGFLWGDAEVTYPDWNGTAQLDERMTGVHLNDLVGLDSGEWMIIGLDIGGESTITSYGS